MESSLKEFLKNKDKTQVYKPKSGGEFNKKVHMYTPEQLEYIRKETRSFNIYWGYAKGPGLENPLGFFEYDDLTLEEIETF